MPYYKKNYRRRYRRYRKKYYKKKPYYMARMALKKVNRIQRRQEKKFHDLEITATDTDWDGLLARLNLIPQGTGDTSRIGDKCIMTSCRIHLRLLLQNRNDAVFRIILIYDKQDVIDTIADLLFVTGQANVINSAYLVDNREQFQVLYDKRWILDDDDKRQRLVNIDRKINKLVKFDAGGTNVLTGGLKLFVMSANADTTPAEFEGYSRVWFADS